VRIVRRAILHAFAAVAALRLVLPAPAVAVSTSPSGLTAQVDYNAVALAWSALSGAQSYNVYRGSSSGGETLMASGITLPANLTNPVYYDLTAANGSTYYYEVSAVSGGLEGARSTEVLAVLPSFTGYAALAYQLIGAPSGIPPYAPDTAYVSAGNETSLANPVNTSAAINNPAPAGVYKDEHNGHGFAYTLGGLQPNMPYIVRLHESENYWGVSTTCANNNNCTGSRVFTVTINGAAVLPRFDIFAAAGGSDIAIGRVFNATANSSGTIYLGFCSANTLTTPTTCSPPSNEADQGKIDAIQVFGQSPQITLTLTASPATALPGTDITYAETFVNVGLMPAVNTAITIPVPSNTCFKLGSATPVSGSSGLSATIDYSNSTSGTPSYGYVPVSGSCGTASTGYDPTVTFVRWTLSGSLSATPPKNSGAIGFSSHVR
jgi:uncharacterized repeat protein (TIGR01451 family)